jgi:protein-disulfide isomerase
MNCSQLRFSPLALASLLVAVTACTPACSPPEAEPPLTSQKARPGDKTRDNPQGGGKAGSQSDPDGEAHAEPDGEPDGEPPAEEAMITEAKGVDLSKLSEPQRTSFFQMLNVEPSACGKAHSLAKSLRDDAECRDSMIAAQFMANRIAVGATPRDIKLELEFVVEALQPKEIDITGRPVYGNERAPVTMVVFADFECPHCRKEAPRLRKIVQQYRGQVKLVYRHFPLNMHARARVAAIATEAAHAQGKFWELHDLVFEHPTQLEDEDLYRYAKQIPGLDFAAFQAHFQARKGEEQVEQDREAGEKLQITGTPAVYVNGRQVNEFLFDGQIEGWIDDALRR